MTGLLSVLKRCLAQAILAICALLFAFSPGRAMAQVVWEDFRGNERVPLPLGNPHYENDEGAPLVTLKNFSSNVINVARSGTSNSINFRALDYTLCNYEDAPGSASCIARVQGRVLWARVQFPQPGNYTFSLAHDDQVDIDVSGNFASNSFKTIVTPH
ncbi:hypothetical protein [Gemmobacter sp. 24YEA27]|uniref:hypothetical protein n=1 Tax=Gemmobacter sp. 24YEA27 TaxID=3040672 RepID=UPI0024B32860|nr:hypothetical protein [Gemmobacter sp. 24YEA27]